MSIMLSQMSQSTPATTTMNELWAIEPDISAIVTEDDTPVDNIYSEKQQRLLTEPLYSSWSGPPPMEGEGRRRPFVAAANVGLFPSPKQPPLVPDMFLSLDVELPADLWQKRHRTYFFWEFGKPPDVVIEVVSNLEGDELGGKRRRYAQMRITYYVVWDPGGHLKGPALRAFELHRGEYVPMDRVWFEGVGLGLTVWEGSFEEHADRWLRWSTADGSVVPMGAERADGERARADGERARADGERARADGERARADRLAEKLRALGIDPEKP
jgi:Uma2 family endonuclease